MSVLGILHLLTAPIILNILQHMKVFVKAVVFNKKAV
jgi:hypothetical protein